MTKVVWGAEKMRKFRYHLWVGIRGGALLMLAGFILALIQLGIERLLR